ncbi:hypothetical protein HHA04nite_03790 [Halomonas halophila]|uniref:Uncharacterized protein n=1 Tax=Halomonas halophila TaxID=29573 RepID=A0ABQ0U0I9_9GAMM|nr:hypothetical protein HHA04nite_03790 [Halomonas halophila]
MKEELAKEARFERLRLERTPTGDIVMPLKDEHITSDEPAHVICPVCKEDKRVSVMTEDEYWYRCPSCKYLAGKKKRPPSSRRGPMVV